MIEEVLQHYEFHNPQFTFIRHNENMTYKVCDGKEKYLLRIHKAAEGLDFSYHLGETPRQVYIKSEIELLLGLISNTGIKVQRPIKNKLGNYITVLQTGDCATLLSWLEGSDLTNVPITEEMAYGIGIWIGRFHNHMMNFQYFNRYCYDEVMVETVIRELEKAQKMKHIGWSHFQCIQSFLLKFAKILQKERQKFILLHADLSKSNLIYHKKQIIPIDFSLSGYSLPEMDLADMSWNLNDKRLTRHLLDGYRSIGKYCLNDLYMDAYFAFSIVFYMASHHDRFHMDKIAQKNINRWTSTIIAPIGKRMKCE